jgi:hypothetical protein
VVSRSKFSDSRGLSAVGTETLGKVAKKRQKLAKHGKNTPKYMKAVLE